MIFHSKTVFQILSDFGVRCFVFFSHRRRPTTDRDALPRSRVPARTRKQAATATAPTPAFPGAANFQYPQIPYAAAAQSFFGAAGAAADADADADAGGKAPRGGASGAPQDERELKRQRRKQSNRESARRSRLRKQAECEELGSRVGGLTEENEKLRGEVKRLQEQCAALSEDNKNLRGSVEAAGGVVDNPAPELPSGPTEEEKKAAAAAGAKAAAEAMEAAKKAAALAAGDSDDADDDGSKDYDDGDSKD